MTYQLTDSKTKAALSMALACCSFSLMTVVINLGCTRIPSMQLIFFRGLLDLLMILPIVFYLKLNIFGNNPWPLFIRATFGVCGASCIFWAVLHMPIANAAALFRTTPLIMPFVAYFTIKEKIYLKNIFLALLGFIGVVMILKPQEDYAFSYAGFVPLLGAFFTAAAFVTIRHLSSKENPFIIMLYFFFLSAIYPLILYSGSFIMPQGNEWYYIALMSIFGFVGQVYVTKAFSYSSANIVTPWTYSEIVFSAIFGYLILNQKLDLLTLLGVIIIFYSALNIRTATLVKNIE